MSPREMVRPRFVVTGLLVTLILEVGGGFPIPWLLESMRVNLAIFFIDWALWTLVGFAVDDLAPKFKDHLATPGHG